MKYFVLKVVLFFSSGVIAATNSWAAQSDTVKVQHVNVLPVIDGMDNDECWNGVGVNWQSIDQVWMPWKGTVPASSDFTGRYKVIWNEAENVMYFLVDVLDDSFIDGFDFASSGPYGYPNYDVVEIFLDENRSKGGHVFDNGSENAQNALSYHISVNSPEDGETTDQFTVEDLDGVSWSNFWVVNYASHFPSFKMKKNGNKYLYEFSLKVYNDAYPTQQKNGSTPTDIEKARVKLTAGKIMGASVAYCDNDDNDGKRDHFFGSTPGKEYTANFGFNGTANSISTENGQKIFNTCWMSANDYGVFRLMGAGTTASSNLPANAPKVMIVLDKASGNLNISIPTTKPGKVIIDVYTFSGSKVGGFADVAFTYPFTGSYNLQSVTPGIYLVKISVDGETYVKKIIR
ncbi:MAG TPA: sugar-binding protein [Prolixibacteraceae bacterium]|nr:sugar-binding protein [Prolixibacteraceae bacterium]